MSSKNKESISQKPTTEVKEEILEAKIKEVPLASESLESETPSPVPIIKRKRVELLSNVDVQAKTITISVDIDVEDIPALSVLRTKAVQADAKAKAIVMKVSKAMHGINSVVSLSPAKLNLIEKKIIVVLGLEPSLDDEQQEAVRSKI